MFSLVIECMVAVACPGFQPIAPSRLFHTSEECVQVGKILIDAAPIPPGLYQIVCRPVPTIPDDGKEVG